MGVKRTIKKSVESDNILLYHAFEEFMEEKEAIGCSKPTLDNYQLSFELFMRFNEFDDTTTTAEINQGLFFKWMNTLKLEGKSVSTINHYLRDCRTFFNWCMATDREYIKPSFKIEMLKGAEEPMKLFYEDDIIKLIKKPNNKDGFTTWRMWAVCNWIMGTGNRAATVCEVRIGDIDFKNKEIYLRHTKNRKFLQIPLSSALATVIKEYIRIWRSDSGKDDYLFPNVGDKPLTTNALKHAFAKYCNDREVERTNIHGLRHSFATQWIASGGSQFQLQEILGHSTLEMTRRYVKMDKQSIKSGYDEHSPLDRLKEGQSRTQRIKRSK